MVGTDVPMVWFDPHELHNRDNVLAVERLIANWKHIYKFDCFHKSKKKHCYEEVLDLVLLEVLSKLQP